MGRKKSRVYKGPKIGPRSYMAFHFMATVFASDKPITLQQCADKLKTSVGNLEELSRKLKKKNLLTSKSGATGGFTLGKNPYDITVGQIIRAIDGKQKADSILGQEISDRCMEPLDNTMFSTVLEKVADEEE